MIEILNILTFMWLAFWGLHAGIHILSGNYQSISFLIVVLFLLNGFPLLMDVLFGQPLYLRFPGFRLASQDLTTAILYCAYISAIPPFWWLIGRRKVTAENSNLIDNVPLQFSGCLRIILYLVLVMPLIIVLFAPNPQLYLTYGWTVTTDTISLEIIDYHTFINLFATLSLLSAMVLLITTEKIRFSTFLMLLPWIAIAIWLNGKRNLVALAAVGIWYILWRKRHIKKFDALLVGLLMVVIVLVYSFAYQETLRGIGQQNGDSGVVYENFRIDYGRDSRIKMAIYAELYPDRMQILEYRGQSILFDMAMYVPRTLWPDKPYPYATYFTSAMFLIPPRPLGWGMTTSWLEEAIANFSWLGLLLGPLLLALFCRVGDSRRNIIAGTMTTLVSSLFLSVHFSAFAPLFILWVSVIVWSRRSIKGSHAAEASSPPEVKASVIS